jgi:hypothetical protein
MPVLHGQAHEKSTELQAWKQKGTQIYIPKILGICYPVQVHVMQKGTYLLGFYTRKNKNNNISEGLIGFLYIHHQKL